MADQRLIDVNEAVKLLRGSCVAKYPSTFLMGLFAAADEIAKLPTVDAVVLPGKPRPLMRDSNPNNTDVYCPECGTNLSGYYGECSLPFVPCFNCGEILDTRKATTRMDGGMKNAEL